MNPIDDINQLGYTSSAPDFLVPRDVAKPQDEADLPALERVLKLINEQQQYYRTTDSISLDEDDNGTIREQMKDNKRMVVHLDSLKMLILSTINKVRETQDERRQ